MKINKLKVQALDLQSSNVLSIGMAAEYGLKVKLIRGQHSIFRFQYTPRNFLLLAKTLLAKILKKNKEGQNL
jgi:hypothetical protein